MNKKRIVDNGVAKEQPMTDSELLESIGLIEKGEYTVPEICQALQLKTRYVQNLINYGEMPGKKRGRSYYVPKENLIAYIRREPANTKTKDGEKELIQNLSTVYKIAEVLEEMEIDPDKWFSRRLRELQDVRNELKRKQQEAFQEAYQQAFRKMEDLD